MNAQCYDSPLTPALSPLRGEGGETLWTSLVATVVWMGSGFVGGRLRTASPTTCEVLKQPVRFVGAVVRALVWDEEHLVPTGRRGAGETPAVRQARGLRYE